MCRSAETAKVGLENQQIKKGVSHEASWTLGIWPVPRDQWTFWNSRLKYQNIYDDSQSCIFACKLMVISLLLGVKSRNPLDCTLKCTCGVDVLPRTFPIGTPDCCPRDFPALLGSGCRCFPNWWCMHFYFYLYIYCLFSQLGDVSSPKLVMYVHLSLSLSLSLSL